MCHIILLVSYICDIHLLVYHHILCVCNILLRNMWYFPFEVQSFRLGPIKTTLTLACLAEETVLVKVIKDCIPIPKRYCAMFVNTTLFVTDKYEGNEVWKNYTAFKKSFLSNRNIFFSEAVIIWTHYFLKKKNIHSKINIQSLNNCPKLNAYMHPPKEHTFWNRYKRKWKL